jgi:hypothetical protein
MTEDERTELLGMLAESRAQYLTLLAGTSDAQWSWKPNEDRWSVGECAEHILRSNEALFQFAKTALATDANPEWQEKTQGKAELLKNVMPNRRPMGQGGATAPMEIRPTGEIARQDLVDRFDQLHTEIREMIKTTDAEVKAHTAEHPFPVFNTLSAYDWLLYIPLHTVRHSRQMIEVMETEGFPTH